MIVEVVWVLSNNVLVLVLVLVLKAVDDSNVLVRVAVAKMSFCAPGV